MLLKRIEINGFKSFANKTEIIVNRGITGIVGPNGSGKSNIADAIRWVLGEQSSKNLRGSKMEDVIFGGSEKRPRKPFCEVSLAFDNSDGRINSDYTEIVISRKMYRTGESEYTLNNASVRLRDILDLIRDTGIGKEGYSIIGQGKVEEILSSKPTARRKVFEEAAGIMKYRTRKEEAEQKLSKTADNLCRVEDILDELERQSGPLKQAAEQTAKYNAAYERLRIIDANLFLYNNEKTAARLDKLKEEQFEIESEISQTGEESGGITEELNDLGHELTEIEQRLDGIHEEMTRAGAGVERIEGDRRLVKERDDNLAAEQERLTKEAAEHQSRVESIDSELAAIKKTDAELEEKQAQVTIVLEGIKEEQEAEDRAAGERMFRIQRIKSRHMELIRSVSEMSSELSRMDAQSEGAAQREKDMSARAELAEEQIAKSEAELKGERAELEAEEQKRLSQATRQNELIMLGRQQKDAAAKARAALEGARAEASEAASRERMLRDLKAEYEGYSDSVRNLMKAAKGVLKLRGTLADLISVPEEHEAAVEAALGGALQNVVVDDEYEAKRAIDLLRQKRLGRVTFLPLSALRIKKLDKNESALLSRPGALAVASDVVHCADDVRPAVEFLLGRTMLIRDMDSAIAIMREADFSFRAVTSSGDIIRPGGAMTGGSTQEKQFGLLSRERLIEQFAAAAERKRGAAKKLETELAAANKAVADAEAQQQALLKALRESEIACAKRRERIASSEQSIQDAHAALAELREALDDSRDSSEDIADKREMLEEKLAQTQTELEEVAKEQGELENAHDGGADKRTDITERAGEARVRAAELAKEREAAANDILRIEREIEGMQSAQSERSARLRQIETQREMLAEQLAQAMDTLQKARAAQSELLVRAAEEERSRQEVRAMISERQRVSGEAQARATSLLERKFKLAAQIEKIEYSREASSNRLWEEYGMTFSQAQELAQEMSYSAMTGESGELRAAIRELGVINPTAIEDYARLSGRVEELTTQRDDLLRADADLRVVIDQLMETMRTIFSDKFAKIDASFEQVFTELFGGGKARLIMGEGDVMECGIEIEAQPPGKKLQQISLLSGGERALTTIALLFAMLAINPSPVCLLDEIDAPLDDVNVGRFSDYLRRIDETQFLVITHRKPTMEKCDLLYGVAMEEKGVSKLISVKMD